MQLIDTHTHLYLPEFDSDRDKVVANAVRNGVVGLLMPNINVLTLEPMLSAADRYPGICYPMTGLHPTSVKDDYLSQVETIEENTGKHRFVAVGETGIDLYRDKTFIKEQIDAFRRHIILSISLNLPLVIHSRDAYSEIFSVLEEFRGEDLKGVFHAFSGDIGIAEKIVSMGFNLGIGGVVTFKNSGLDRVVKEIGPEHIVAETDSPYLAPVPHRGKRNESSYICIINRKLSEIFEMSVDETASVLYRNSLELFKYIRNE